MQITKTFARYTQMFNEMLATMPNANGILMIVSYSRYGNGVPPTVSFMPVNDATIYVLGQLESETSTTRKYIEGIYINPKTDINMQIAELICN